MVEPGGYPTAIWSRGANAIDVSRVGAYRARSDIWSSFNSSQAPDPQEVADIIAELVALPPHKRPLRRVVASERERIGAEMLNAVSERVIEAISAPAEPPRSPTGPSSG